MISGFNYVLLFLVAVICFGLYAVKYDSQQTERTVARLKREIAAEYEELRVLQAEWALRTEPGRLQRLTEKYLDLGPVHASQIVSLTDLPIKEPPPAGTPDFGHAALTGSIFFPPMRAPHKGKPR